MENNKTGRSTQEQRNTGKAAGKKEEKDKQRQANTTLSTKQRAKRTRKQQPQSKKKLPTANTVRSTSTNNSQQFHLSQKFTKAGSAF